MIGRFVSWLRGTPPPLPLWDLRTPLLSWSKSPDVWTIRDAVEGTLILGATGSGKTSGSGKLIAQSMLAAGFGGIVLTAKREELALWESYCRAAGRQADLMVFGSGEPLRFNFLDFEATRAGEGAGHTENLVSLLSTVMEVAERGTSGSGAGRSSDPYWRQAAKQLLRNLVELCLLANGRVSVPDLYKLAITAPNSIENARSERFRGNSYCFQCLAAADRKPKTPEQRRDLEVVADFFMLEWPALSEKTRSVVLSTFSSMLDVLNRGLLRTLFCGETNVTPHVVEEGKILVIALPVKEFAEVGQIAQVLWKYAFMRAIERRDVARNPRPVFLWADEAQHFVTSYDAQFHATCRSSRVAPVLLTQNLSGFEAALGGSEKGRAETAALFGNLATKLFHANSDPETNEWGSKLIGRTLQTFTSSSHSYQQDDWAALGLGLPRAGQATAGVTESYEYELQPRAFTFLRTGGPDNGMLVDAVLFQNGRRFAASGNNYLHVTMRQVP